jgi:hypothetical protein
MNEQLLEELTKKIEDKTKEEFMLNLDICFLKKLIPTNAEPKDFEYKHDETPPSSSTLEASYKGQKLYTMTITVTDNYDVKVETVWSRELQA